MWKLIDDLLELSRVSGDPMEQRFILPFRPSQIIRYNNSIASSPLHLKTIAITTDIMISNS
ncbi:hypothetical protein [Moorena bouillonii]|uniref:Uncharacterized protein n=1 Tax=Moorena bouillonii PNG TaxID=568701 RepID=A0A1U7NAD0_9CYAN|nr:hypothetical protein [Moorena bouillonii]OLT62889.1 hypothetical protein BJP37_31505 [Moorena bouillonii PNG]